MPELILSLKERVLYSTCHRFGAHHHRARPEAPPVSSHKIDPAHSGKDAVRHVRQGGGGGGGGCVAGSNYCGGDKVSGDKDALYQCRD